MKKTHRGYMITGTNTDMGKTIVTAGLTLALAVAGEKVLPIKPVQTGLHTISGDLAYIQAVWQSSGLTTPVSLAPIYDYPMACSPHLAAEMAQVPYASVPHIVNQINMQLSQYDVLLVEGAGGVYVPLDRQHTFLDVMVALQFPVIVVSHSGLGAINDICLTVTVLQQRHIPVLGFLLNQGVKRKYNQPYIVEDNAKTITQFMGVPYLGCIPYIENTDNAQDLIQVFSHAHPLIDILLRKEPYEKNNT